MATLFSHVYTCGYGSQIEHALPQARNALFVVFPYRGRATLRHEWSGSTGVISRSHRNPVFNGACSMFFKVSDDTGEQYPNPIPLHIL